MNFASDCLASTGTTVSLALLLVGIVAVIGGLALYFFSKGRVGKGVAVLVLAGVLVGGLPTGNSVPAANAVSNCGTTPSVSALRITFRTDGGTSSNLVENDLHPLTATVRVCEKDAATPNCVTFTPTDGFNPGDHKDLILTGANKHLTFETTSNYIASKIEILTASNMNPTFSQWTYVEAVQSTAFDSNATFSNGDNVGWFVYDNN